MLPSTIPRLTNAPVVLRPFEPRDASLIASVATELELSDSRTFSALSAATGEISTYLRHMNALSDLRAL
jgi:hypothetical protein